MDLKIARLRTVYDLVPPCQRLIDVGTDHGYLAVALVASGKVDTVIASDYNKGPLASAAAYVAEQGLSQRIELRLGDGLTVLAQGNDGNHLASVPSTTVQGATICGMGGFLMRDIIESSPQRLSFYVLQPQNGLAELRHYMRDKGYRIVAEEACHDRGHDYEAWLLVDEEGPQWILDYCEDKYGGAFTSDVYKDLDDDDFRWEFGYFLCKFKSKDWRLHMEHQLAIGKKERKHLVNCKGQEERLAYLDRRIAFIEESLGAFTREEDGSVSS